MSHPEAIFAARTVTIQRVVTNTFGEASERNFGLIHVRFGQKLPRVPARGAAAIPLEAARRHCSTGQEKRPGIDSGPPSFRLRMDLIVHAAHAAARHGRSPTVLLWPFSNHGFRGD